MKVSVTKSLCSIKGETLIYKYSFVATENGVAPIARYSPQLLDIKHGKWKVERRKVVWKEESNVKRGVSASPRNKQGVSASPIIRKGVSASPINNAVNSSYHHRKEFGNDRHNHIRIAEGERSS